jgi:hypothetical protein
VSTPAPVRPKRGSAAPETGGRSRAWTWLQHALSITVIGAAAITGLQLGLNAPAVSPVQPAAVSVGSTTGSSPALAPPVQQALPAPARDRTARGRGRGR